MRIEVAEPALGGRRERAAHIDGLAAVLGTTDRRLRVAH